MTDVTDAELFAAFSRGYDRDRNATYVARNAEGLRAVADLAQARALAALPGTDKENN